MNETSEKSHITEEDRQKFQALFVIAQQVFIDLGEQEARLEAAEELKLTRVQEAISDLTEQGMMTLKEMWNLIMIAPAVPKDPECRPQYDRKIPLVSTEDTVPDTDGDDGPGF